MLRFMIAATLVAVTLWSAGATAMSIGVFADSLGSDCSLTIPFPGDPVTLYVVASLVGIEGYGVTASAFRIIGIPEDWTREIVAAPGWYFFGDVLGAGATGVAGLCYANTPLLLMKLMITPTTLVHGVAVAVVPHAEDTGACPFNSEACGPCARFCGCTPEVPECNCATAIESRINAPCSVAITSDTWGAVKSLFR